ncbi:hypothetical protein EB118_23000, partial [bacterium]|nr:hypothetical protein [bacterium]
MKRPYGETKCNFYLPQFFYMVTYKYKMGQAAGPPGPPGPPGKSIQGDPGLPGNDGSPGMDGNVNIDTTNVNDIVFRLSQPTSTLPQNLTKTMTSDATFVGSVANSLTSDRITNLANAMLASDNKRFVSTVVNTLTGPDYYSKLPQGQISNDDINRFIKPRTLWCADGSQACYAPPNSTRNFFTGDMVIGNTNRFVFGTGDGTTANVATDAGMQYIPQQQSGKWQMGPFVWGVSGGSLGVSSQISDTDGPTLSWNNKDVSINRGNLTVGDGSRGNITMRGSQFIINSSISTGTGGTAISVDPSETLVLNQYGHFDGNVRVGGGGLSVERDLNVGTVSGGNLYVGLNSRNATGGNITQYGTTFNIKNYNAGGGGRALMQTTTGRLVINAGGDFNDGVEVQSKL